MVKRHMLRMSAPRTWPIKRKELVFITRPNCGPHKMENCLPIGVVLKEILGCANTTKEARFILQEKSVLINKKAEIDPKTQVGFMDTIEIPKLKLNYRMIFNTRGKLSLKEISAQEAGIKISKILKKQTIKNNKTQLSLDDGTNIQVQKDEHKQGDSVVLTLPDRKVKTSLKLEKGAAVYMLGGKNMGTVGTVESIKEGTATQKGMITVKTKKETFETRKDYAFVVGKDKPMVDLE